MYLCNLIRFLDNRNFILKNIILNYIQSCIYMWIVIFKFECHYKSINYFLPASSTMSKLCFQILILRTCLQDMDKSMHPLFPWNFSPRCYTKFYVVSRIILAIILIYDLCLYLTKPYPHQYSTLFLVSYILLMITPPSRRSIPLRLI